MSRAGKNGEHYREFRSAGLRTMIKINLDLLIWEWLWWLDRDGSTSDSNELPRIHPKAIAASKCEMSTIGPM